MGECPLFSEFRCDVAEQSCHKNNLNGAGKTSAYPWSFPGRRPSDSPRRRSGRRPDTPKAFVQLYWSGSREVIEERVERFRRAGTKGIILTLDNAGVTARDWGSPVPTWREVVGLKEIWGGPLMVKGVLSPDDALRAIDTGATTVVVSLHGGNNLDTPRRCDSCRTSS